MKILWTKASNYGSRFIYCILQLFYYLFLSNCIRRFFEYRTFISQLSCSQTQFTKSIRVCTVCSVFNINRSYSPIPIWTTNHLYELKVLRNGSSWQCPLQTRLIVQTAEQTGWSSPLQKVGRKFAMIWYRRGAASCEILWLITIITPHHPQPALNFQPNLNCKSFCANIHFIFSQHLAHSHGHTTQGEILQFALQTSASRALSSIWSSKVLLLHPQAWHIPLPSIIMHAIGYNIIFTSNITFDICHNGDVNRLKCDLHVTIVRL